MRGPATFINNMSSQLDSQMGITARGSIGIATPMLHEDSTAHGGASMM
jgi:hypothetical protein